MTLWGSPPRMRGKVVGTPFLFSLTGITPACAGKSGRESGTRACCRDHPRVCGEKVNLEAGVCRVWGSPPRVRGKGQGFQVCKVARGITPAYAGKSQFLPTAFHRAQDHPRVCGEKARLGRFWLSAWGSPPHMRGKGVSLSGHISVKRITPACAGKSCPVPSPS